MTHPDRYSILIDILRAEAPNAVDSFFAYVRGNEPLSAVVDSGESTYIYPALLVFLTSIFTPDMIEALVSRVNARVTHEEVAYASSLEPQEEMDYWESWEQIDARSAYDDKLALYRQY